VARGHAGEDGPGKGVSRKTGSPVVNRRQGARGRDTQRVHRFADKVFAQHRPQRCAAVTTAGKGRASRALELDVAANAGAVEDLAHEDRPAIAQLRNETAELVPA